MSIVIAITRLHRVNIINVGVASYVNYISSYGFLHLVSFIPKCFKMIVMSRPLEKGDFIINSIHFMIHTLLLVFRKHLFKIFM